MADLTPEHASRRMDGDLHPEVRAAYKYVESVIPTADAQSPVGGYAWHGWSLREAFLAGCTHARTQLAQSEPKKSKPVVDYSRVPEIATEAQIRSAAQYLVKKRNCDGDLIPAIKYAIARWGRSTPQPEGEELTDEKLLRMAATEIGYEFTGSWFLTGRNSPNLEVTPLELLNLMRAVLALWGRPTPQPPADGEVEELVKRLKSVKRNDNSIPSSVHWGLSDGTIHHHRTHVTSNHASDCDRAAELLQRQHPQPPADGEVGALVAKLRRLAPQNPLGNADPTITRTAELLQRFASPACLVINPSPEAAAAFGAAHIAPGRIELLPDGTQIIEPAEHTLLVPVLQPVPVAERPWEREEWCDDEGRCWFGAPQDGAADAGWILRKPSERLSHQSVSLPAHALPLPASKEGEE